MAKKAPSLIFSATEYFGNLVDLHHSQWHGHIISPDGHPEMSGHENLVLQVLKDPEEIWVGAHPSSAVFVSAPGAGPGAVGIRVVAAYESEMFQKGSTTGKIITAYPIHIPRTKNMTKRLFKKGSS